MHVTRLGCQNQPFSRKRVHNLSPNGLGLKNCLLPAEPGQNWSEIPI